MLPPSSCLLVYYIPAPPRVHGAIELLVVQLVVIERPRILAPELNFLGTLGAFLWLAESSVAQDLINIKPAPKVDSKDVGDEVLQIRFDAVGKAVLSSQDDLVHLVDVVVVEG